MMSQDLQRRAKLPRRCCFTNTPQPFAETDRDGYKALKFLNRSNRSAWKPLKTGLSLGVLLERKLISSN